MNFAHVVAAVIGDNAATHSEYLPADILAAADGRIELTATCDAATKARDEAAYRLNLLGYDEKEITELLHGQLTRAELDARHALTMTGFPQREESPGPVLWPGLPRAKAGMPVPPAPAPPDCDSRSSGCSGRVPASPAAAGVVAPDAPAGGRATASSDLDACIRRYAAAYQVDYLLIAAMVRHESNWQPSVVSSKGAIGLMQLMPDTAAMLGVNPNDPQENLRGGIAYLAGLLRTYKDVRLALIAYNAGPEHANKVGRGEIGVFPETQHYLDTINASYALPGTREP